MRFIFKPKARNIIGALYLDNKLSKEEQKEYETINTLINTKAYKKTTYCPFVWKVNDAMMQSLGDRAENPLEDEVILKEVMKTKFLLKRFLQEISEWIKAVKQIEAELLSELHKAKEDKALQLKELLSKLSLILHLQKEHTELNTSQLEISTYSKLLSLHP